MGTRADFYIKRSKAKDIEWLGSIAFDGYIDGIDKAVLKAKDSHSYIKALAKFFAERDDVTIPSQGWPWPWDNSDTTDCAYCFNGERTVFYLGDGKWGRCIDWDEDEKGKPQPVIWEHAVPDMSKIKRVTMGKRSGLIVIGC
jgi:hypothetical protein